MVDKIKKILTNKTLIILLIVTIARILISSNLPIYYFKNLPFDDYLMINQAESIIDGDYLGNYNDKTLIKGLVYPFFLAFCNHFNLSYSLVLTILYILSCIYFTTSLNKLVKNKKWLIFLYIILLFNPISYSMELFQRIYRNALSFSQLLFFFGIIIHIISSKKIKSNIFYYILLGLITSMMLLTREDSMWSIVTIFLLIIYKIFTIKNIKIIITSTIPIIVISVILNNISTINNKYYKINTYNEINKSSFNEAYIKIQEIKDDKKKSRYSIPKSTFYKLIDLTETFDFTSEQIDELYKNWGDKNKEIDNGSIIWAFRYLIYEKEHFINGMEADRYFKDLSSEIEKLFKEGKLEREKIIPSVLINTPTISDIKKLPIDFLKTLKYVSTYENIKSIDRQTFLKIKNIGWDKNIHYYYAFTPDYNDTENFVKKNVEFFDIINLFYKYFTVIFSILSLLIFFKNIKRLKEEKQFILFLLLISYFIIICGVTYTHTTAFIAIRYYYLGPVYLLQNIFIILTLEGVNYERIKTNYLNALSKRRENFRKLYNRSQKLFKG